MFFDILASFGGKQPLEDRDKISELISFVSNHVQEYIDTDIEQLPFEIVKVEEAFKQIVSGVLYELHLILSEAFCFRQLFNSEDEYQKCNDQLKDDSSSSSLSNHCNISIWEQVWLNKTEINSINCFLMKKDLLEYSRVKHKARVNLPMNYTDYMEQFEIKELQSDDVSRDALKQLQSPQNFKQFVKKYNKFHKGYQYNRRFLIFKENMKKVQFLRETELGTGRYGATIFADLTSEEFKKHYTGLRHPNSVDNNHEWPDAIIPNVSLPDSFDWRDQEVVTPVKNQGFCGSCWAFSVTGNIEGQMAIKNGGKLTSLSEQELVDCDKLDHGCEGGMIGNAYKSIIKLGGLESEKDYSYDGKDEKCSLDKGKIVAKIRGGINLPTNENEIAKWLIVNGPVSIGINANAMQFYMGGVSHPWSFLCRKSGIDHGVLIVGYGIHRRPILNSVLPFWIIKNSWGPRWGEQGYYRVYRGDGTCGVNQMASSAVVETTKL